MAPNPPCEETWQAGRLFTLSCELPAGHAGEHRDPNGWTWDARVTARADPPPSLG